MAALRHIRRCLLAGAVAVVALPGGAHAFDPKTDRETHLLSRAHDGGFPNGPSRNGAIAQNAQGASFTAFESDATDIVPDDPNGLTDVFLVRRGGTFATDLGEPWQPAGPAELVSRGYDGSPANGRSYLPDLDGSALHRSPRCLAFVSEASNLVPGDTNGKADAFVKDLLTGAVARVSLGRRGAQSNGATYDTKLDGGCTRVAFTSDATNLHLAKSALPRGRSRRRLRPLVTRAPAPGTKQVYVRFLSRKRDNRGLGGVTFLASASNRRVPGAGDSYDVSFGRLGDGCPRRCGTTSGDSVSFTSTASNLAPGDANGVEDVYQRTFFLPGETYRHRRRRIPRFLTLRTNLISATSEGRAGNGPSKSSASNDDGEFVAFETMASDLIPGDDNRHSDIAVRGTLPESPRMQWASRAAETGPGNAGSHNPAITSPASIFFYESDATNLQPNPPSDTGWLYDRNCMRDVFFWNTVSRNASLQSRDSDNQILNQPEDYGRAWTDRCPPVLARGATNPVSSYYGNYFLFESSYPLIDKPLAQRTFAPLLRNLGAAARSSHDDPVLHQVYLRYNGPAREDATFPPSEWPLP